MGVEEWPMMQGEYVSWANISLALDIHEADIFRTKDFSKIDWKDSLEPGEVYGTGPIMQGRTVGQYKAEGSIEMRATSARRFMQALAKRKRAIGLVEFDLVGKYSPLTSGSVVDKAMQAANRVDVILKSCRLKERSSSDAIGTEATNIMFPLHVMQVIVNKTVLV